MFPQSGSLGLAACGRHELDQVEVVTTADLRHFIRFIDQQIGNDRTANTCLASFLHISFQAMPVHNRVANHRDQWHRKPGGTLRGGLKDGVQTHTSIKCRVYDA